jgi:hypothetical protein
LTFTRIALAPAQHYECLLAFTFCAGDGDTAPE